jgi:hypothetical protein
MLRLTPFTRVQDVLRVVNQTNNSDLVPIHSFPFVQVGFCYATWHLMIVEFFFFFFGVIFCRMQTLNHLLVQGKKLPLLQEYKPEL